MLLWEILGGVLDMIIYALMVNGPSPCVVIYAVGSPSTPSQIDALENAQSLTPATNRAHPLACWLPVRRSSSEKPYVRTRCFLNLVAPSVRPDMLTGLSRHCRKINPGPKEGTEVTSRLELVTNVRLMSIFGVGTLKVPRCNNHTPNVDIQARSSGVCVL